VPPLAAAVIAGRINADVMTLDAAAAPRALTDSGFRFAHEDIRTGVAAALAAPAGPQPSRTA
jgi:NAD dependent epimerase/dehydratase family enzyme